MKTSILLLACALAGAAAMAEAPGPGNGRAPDAAPASAICPGFADLAPPEGPLARVQGRIDDAIRELDHARLELPSPVLATGKLTHLGITVTLPEPLERVRVLGYFELHGNAACLIPLTVNHIETIDQNAGKPGAELTRIHFRVPEIDRFTSSLAVYQRLTLRIAAFDYEDHALGHIHFGRSITLHTSNKSASVGAALLFAFGFYLLTAQAVAAATGAGSGPGPSGWRAALRRLAPWNLVGDGAQTALAQLQMLMFTLIVATLLFYQWMRTGLLHDLSSDLLYLIGISTLGAAGSQMGNAMKKGLDPAMYRYAQRLDWFTAPLAQASRRTAPAGLLTTNKRLDIYKFQMLVFSVVIAAYVIEAGADELDKLHISATLLTLMGISQGAYVGGNVTSDSMTVLQDQLRGMHKLQERYRNSSDTAVRGELRRRFRIAAGRAAAPFGVLFGRAIPDYLLELPIDADAAPVAQDEDEMQAGPDAATDIATDIA